MSRGREGKVPRAYVLGDDAELNRDLTQDLTGAGWEVQCFPAFEALAAAWQRTSPTCVLVDAEWHSADATAVFKLHRLYRDVPRASRVPFILMMDAGDAASRAAADSGAVLTLPYRPSDLVAVLTRVRGQAPATRRRGRSRDADSVPAPAPPAPTRNPAATTVESAPVVPAASPQVTPTGSPTAPPSGTPQASAPPGPSTQPGPPTRTRNVLTDHQARVAAERELGSPTPALRVVGGAVNIPASVATLAAAAPDELPLPPGARRDPDQPVLVLIADEDEVVIDLLSFHSTSNGWGVITASDGETAERLIREQHPHIAVLGANLPYRSGFDIVERLREEQVAYDTRFVALSAQSQADNVLRAFGVGFSEFIGKPFDPAVVIGRLQRLVLDA